MKRLPLRLLFLAMLLLSTSFMGIAQESTPAPTVETGTPADAPLATLESEPAPTEALPLVTEDPPIPETPVETATDAPITASPTAETSIATEESVIVTPLPVQWPLVFQTTFDTSLPSELSADQGWTYVALEQSGAAQNLVSLTPALYQLATLADGEIAASVYVKSGAVMLILREQTNATAYRAFLSTDSVSLWRGESQLGSATGLTADEWASVAFRAEGAVLTLSVNGAAVITVTDAVPLGAGLAGFSAAQTQDDQGIVIDPMVRVDNVVLSGVIETLIPQIPTTAAPSPEPTLIPPTIVTDVPTVEIVKEQPAASSDLPAAWPEYPDLISPENNAVLNNAQPTFTWHNDDSSDRIEIDNDPAFGSPEITGSASAPYMVDVTFTPSTPLAAGVYYWRVKSYYALHSESAWSPVRKFTIDLTPPPVPFLVSPAQNALLITSRPTFTWSPASTATGYEIQVATDNGFVELASLPNGLPTASSLPMTVSMDQGPYWWRVRARDVAGNFSAWSDVRTFTINFRRQPTNGGFIVSTGEYRPSFVWYPAAGATGYLIDVATDEAFTHIVYSSPPLAANLTSFDMPSTYPTPLEYGRYYWRLVPQGLPITTPTPGFNVFTVTPSLPTAPALNLPANNGVTKGSTPTLSWVPLSDAASGGPFDYELQVDEAITFAIPEWSSGAVDTSPIDVAVVLAEGAHYWRVRSVNRYGVTSVWSPARRLFVDLTPPASPVLKTPLDNAIVPSPRPTFTWQASPTAVAYRLDVSVDESFGVTLPLTNTAATSLALPLTLQQGRYVWRVVAIDAAGNESQGGEVREFDLNVQLTPAANAALPGQRVTFTWSLVPTAQQIQLELAMDEEFNVPLSIAGLDAPIPLPGNATRYTLPANLPYGSYYWRVSYQLPGDANVVFPTSGRRFTVSPAALTAPALSSPANNASLNTSTFDLTWIVPAAWASLPYDIGYEVQMDDQAAFNDPEFVTDPFATPDTTVTVSGLDDARLYWRVRAVNQWGIPGAWSAVRVVIIDTTPPAVPAPKTPADEAFTGLRPTFSWGAVVGAVRYRLALYEDQALSVPVAGVPAELTTAAYTPAFNLKQGHTYWWTVSAKDLAGNWGEASEAQSFSVNIQSSPANGSVVTTQKPVLSWTTTYGATSIQITISRDEFFTDTLPLVTRPGTATNYVPTAPLAYGTYWWMVNLVRGAVVEEQPIEWARSFTVSPAAPPAPTGLHLNGVSPIANPTPELAWNAVSAALPGAPFTYVLQVDNQATFLTPEFAINGYEDTTIALSALADGVYSGRVQAVNDYGARSPWSAMITFTVDTTPPAAPTLTAPLNDASVAVPQPTFSWSVVPGATRYVVELSTTGDFAQSLHFTTTSLTFIPPSALLPTTYVWRVTAQDQAGNLSMPSEVRSLTVTSATNAAPVLNRYSSADVVLRWSPVSWALDYEVQVSVAGGAAFTGETWSEIVPASEWQYTLPNDPEQFPDGTYHWRVRAKSGPTTWSAWSTIRSFVVHN